MGALLLESIVDRVVVTGGTVLGVVRPGRVVGVTGTVLGLMRPSLGSLWVPWPSWVPVRSVSGSCWVGALPLVCVVGTVAVLQWTPHPPAGYASTATPYRAMPHHTL